MKRRREFHAKKGGLNYRRIYTERERGKKNLSNDLSFLRGGNKIVNQTVESLSTGEEKGKSGGGPREALFYLGRELS